MIVLCHLVNNKVLFLNIVKIYIHNFLKSIQFVICRHLYIVAIKFPSIKGDTKEQL